MIDLNLYNLTHEERSHLEKLLSQVSTNPSLEQLWGLMDQAWADHKCDNRSPSQAQLAAFYADPVWLLNGMFIEQHEESMCNREAITRRISSLKPRDVIDYGGGFGTLARLIAGALPNTLVTICEPYPPRHGIEVCKQHENIRFSSELSPGMADVLVSTDVIEHLPDPLPVLAKMVESVREGGHLVIHNHFYPTIKCHLPQTFHLRYSFPYFCKVMGLTAVDSYCYQRTGSLVIDWPRLRRREAWSKRFFPVRDRMGAWPDRIRRATRDPGYYPKRVLEWLRTP